MGIGVYPPRLSWERGTKGVRGLSTLVDPDTSYRTPRPVCARQSGNT